jgi:hypothetical protein
MKRLIVSFLLTIGFCHSAFSQGEYILRGRNGIAGGAGISVRKEINGSFFYAGISYKGFIDAGITYWRSIENTINDEIFTPRITYYPIKQEDAKIAPTIGISLGYKHYRTKSITLIDIPQPDLERRIDTIRKDMAVDAVIFGVNAYRKIANIKGAYLQLMIGTDISTTDTGLEFILHSGLSIGARIGSLPLLVFMPGIDYQGRTVTYFLKFSIVS